MSNFTPDQLREILSRPNYTLGHAAVHYSPHTGPTPIMESDLRDGALGKGKTKKGHTGRVLIRVTSFRVRLLDEDNLCEKFHVDCCRYAGLLSSDAPGQTKIETGQVKVRRKDQEHVLIEIESTLTHKPVAYIKNE